MLLPAEHFRQDVVYKQAKYPWLMTEPPVLGDCSKGWGFQSRPDALAAMGCISCSV